LYSMTLAKQIHILLFDSISTLFEGSPQ